jgi:TolB-like protein
VSFFEELKQRRVIRVATVYLVVAWVAIQAASIALPAFDAPGWTLRVIILLFALGFPLALLLSWALDVTPEGLRFTAGKVGNKRMATISAALAALAVAWYFLGQPAFRPGAVAPERSIAVLPFVNMSGNAANDYFSDGLAETTLDMLAQVPDLKVIARTSSFAFKGKATDMREIGRQLGAAHVLEGSVQQAGDTVRITVQLIRAKDGSHLWSKQFDRRMTDVFHIQDEIATSVVDALALQLPESTQRRMVRKRTDNVAAYDAYLQGMALMPKRDVGDMRRALAHFERAIRIDPGYARAYVGAHDALHLIDNYGHISQDERRKEQAYLQRALQLAPDMGEVQVARGVSLEMANQPEAAEAAYRRGVALAPGYATGWQWLGNWCPPRSGATKMPSRCCAKRSRSTPCRPSSAARMRSRSARPGTSTKPWPRATNSSPTIPPSHAPTTIAACSTRCAAISCRRCATCNNRMHWRRTPSAFARIAASR